MTSPFTTFFSSTHVYILTPPRFLAIFITPLFSLTSLERKSYLLTFCVFLLFNSNMNKTKFVLLVLLSLAAITNEHVSVSSLNLWCLTGKGISEVCSNYSIVIRSSIESDHENNSSKSAAQEIRIPNTNCLLETVWHIIPPQEEAFFKCRIRFATFQKREADAFYVKTYCRYLNAANVDVAEYMCSDRKNTTTTADLILVSLPLPGCIIALILLFIHGPKLFDKN